MGKLSTFEILVDNREAVVKAGDTLRGQVLLELTDDVDVNEIRICFTGRSHVHFAGPQSQNSSPMSEVQASAAEQEHAEEVYCNQVLTLFPSAPREGARRPSHALLSWGSHKYDFDFVVPPTCPDSFAGVHGFVRYILKAVVERAWKVDFNLRAVTVLSELDLNCFPETRDAVELSGDLHIFSLFFPSGDCHATLRLARKGVVPGEVIPAEFCVHNGSHQELHKVSLHLRMTVIYRAGRQKCTIEVPLAKVDLGKVPAGKTLQGRDRALRVPLHSPPSGLPGCSIISVLYKVELKIKPALLSLKRLKLTTDIIVGTISLDVFSQSDKPPDYWSCCPPTYNDVVTSFPWVLPLPPNPTPRAAAQGATGDDPSPRVISFCQEGTVAPPLVAPPAYNDEPRLTVLRQAACPQSEEPPGAQARESHPLLRPRANTGPSRSARTRGR